VEDGKNERKITGFQMPSTKWFFLLQIGVDFEGKLKMDEKQKSPDMITLSLMKVGSL